MIRDFLEKEMTRIAQKESKAAKFHSRNITASEVRKGVKRRGKVSFPIRSPKFRADSPVRSASKRFDHDVKELHSEMFVPNYTVNSHER